MIYDNVNVNLGLKSISRVYIHTNEGASMLEKSY
jgi:hypothetical protein